MKPLKSINERIRYVMDALGYDESHFSRKVGVSVGALINVVHSKEDPSYALLKNICAVLPVNERWLMIGEGKPWSSDNIEGWMFGSKYEEAHHAVIKEINERFKQFRLFLGLSQTLFASEMSVTRDVVSNIETYRSSPTIQMLIELDKKFKMNILWLIYGDPPMVKK